MYRTLLFAGEIIRGCGEDYGIHYEGSEKLYSERKTEFENINDNNEESKQ